MIVSLSRALVLTVFIANSARLLVRESPLVFLSKRLFQLSRREGGGGGVCRDNLNHRVSSGLGPFIVYMLRDVDIMEDWTAIKKANAALTPLKKKPDSHGPRHQRRADDAQQEEDTDRPHDSWCCLPLRQVELHKSPPPDIYVYDQKMEGGAVGWR
ncbi:hypothetical protein NHX12_013608 [Muraenolepis orangiensis]|uniref:Uncharacterized protein n=1 Tax=Muraenolepis orangiensis TaxID=630683 RepID=A0A9Q0DD91_9TELE|nr:hypothetical protein NHX12_013608 [Muraenolepis orangiensis]